MPQNFSYCFQSCFRRKPDWLEEVFIFEASFFFWSRPLKQIPVSLMENDIHNFIFHKSQISKSQIFCSWDLQGVGFNLQVSMTCYTMNLKLNNGHSYFILPYTLIFKVVMKVWLRSTIIFFFTIKVYIVIKRF